MAKEFVKIGERIRFIGASKTRNESWPDGSWLEKGIEGQVAEYHPEQKEVFAGGKVFEAIPPYAVVHFDNGAVICIDPDEEYERWERI